MIKNKLDVRNSPEERKLVEQSIKGHNRLKGSKYIKPTTNIFGSYNASQKVAPQAITPDLINEVIKEINDNTTQDELEK